MTTLRTRTVASLALAVLPLALVAGASGAARPRLLPDDLAFLNSPVIDDVIAGAEGGRVECAALSSVMGIAFASALVSSDFDFGEPSDSEVPATTEAAPTAEAFWAVAAPLLVPLLDRVSTDDPAGAALVEIAGLDLVNAIYELRDQGLTDDDLLLVQESFAFEMLATDVVSTDSSPVEPDDSDLDGLATRVEDLITHDFESITFLDEDAGAALPGTESDALPWEAECPDTADMLNFDDIDVEVSASIDFEVVVTIP